MSDYYKPCHCGAHCYQYYCEEEKIKCQGQVTAIDEVSYGDEWDYIHACEYHADKYLDA